MDASPEVMQPVVVPQTRPALSSGERSRPVDAAKVATLARRGSEQRVSEDPMRTTDRYRLVMPYSNRV